MTLSNMLYVKVQRAVNRHRNTAVIVLASALCTIVLFFTVWERWGQDLSPHGPPGPEQLPVRLRSQESDVPGNEVKVLRDNIDPIDADDKARGDTNTKARRDPDNKARSDPDDNEDFPSMRENDVLEGGYINDLGGKQHEKIIKNLPLLARDRLESEDESEDTDLTG